MNYQDLTIEITNAARLTFSDLQAQHPDETFYTFILYTDSDCYTLVPAANSVQKLDAALKELKNPSTSGTAYCRWHSAAWAYEAWDGKGRDAFQRICEKLGTQCDQVCEDPVAFLSFKQSVHSSMMEALHTLDKDNFFGKDRDTVTLFVSISDDNGSLDLENQSSEFLNSTKTHSVFSKRYAS